MAEPLTGRPLRRLEDRPLVRGEATFTADARDPHLDGAVYVVFVRSPVAAGTIDSIDPTDAAAKPGVLATLTGADVDAPAPFSLGLGPEYAQPLLPTSTVGFAGQVVAAVVAETLAARTSERQGRLIDHDQTGAMERKKHEGYF